MSIADRCRWLLITSGGLGTSPFAPGTVGTLGGVLLAVTLQWLLPEHAVLAWSIAAVVLFLWGCLQSEFVARTWPKEDPGQFVLDEVVGYLVTVIVYALLAQRLPGAFAHMAAFFAFRAFDVLKIQPAKKLEDLPGAWGIMADDQMAGVYAGLSIWIVLPLFGA
ncbi:MAG TPA: phosphatidylglycerophosphatase A [Planctomycetota bacterium]|nr:phosphatidylglycerophosphatase A [Planctomycetota bacterium]